jgi:hypothetical protein
MGDRRLLVGRQRPALRPRSVTRGGRRALAPTWPSGAHRAGRERAPSRRSPARSSRVEIVILQAALPVLPAQKTSDASGSGPSWPERSAAEPPSARAAPRACWWPATSTDVRPLRRARSADIQPLPLAGDPGTRPGTLSPRLASPARSPRCPMALRRAGGDASVPNAAVAGGGVAAPGVDRQAPAPRARAQPIRLPRQRYSRRRPRPRTGAPAPAVTSSAPTQAGRVGRPSGPGGRRAFGRAGSSEGPLSAVTAPASQARGPVSAPAP